MTDHLFVATRKGLFKLARTAPAPGWRIVATAFLGDNVTNVLADRRDGSVYAALDHGHFGVKLHRSDDGGMTFKEIATPAYPARPADREPDLCPMRQVEIPWTLNLAWVLESGGQDQPGMLWCGTLPGGLFVSRDRGESWTLNQPLWENPARKKWAGGGYDLPGIHSICVDPRAANRVAVGVSCGGVWITEDGGATWACRAKGMFADYAPPEQRNDPEIQDPHRVVQCPAQPDVYWAQHHNGVFRSTDGCASWQEVSDVPPSVFGFAVAVHPDHGDTAWLVPAIKDEKRIPVDGRVVVTRTRDGGQSFEVLGEGLPQEHAYDLVFRHALDIAPNGDTLALGSTTGSLWATDDQGDHWHLLSAHLPPIHAVRFA
jgi:hypothetical protein